MEWGLLLWEKGLYWTTVCSCGEWMYCQVSEQKIALHSPRRRAAAACSAHEDFQGQFQHHLADGSRGDAWGHLGLSF